MTSTSEGISGAPRVSGKALTKYIFPISLAIFLAALAYKANWELIRALDFSVIWEFRAVFWKGLRLSLIITLVAGTLGVFFGILLAVISQSPIAPLRWIVAGYVEIWRNTPLLVQLFWLYFAVPMMTGFSMSVLATGFLAMTLQASAYFTEIVRAGIESIHRGQWDAAYALGLPAWTRWTRVILPPALRIMIPPMVNLTISFFKATAILSLLQVSEFMTVASRVSNHTFKPIEIFTFAALVYFVIGYAMSRATLRLEYFLQEKEH